MMAPAKYVARINRDVRDIRQAAYGPLIPGRNLDCPLNETRNGSIECLQNRIGVVAIFTECFRRLRLHCYRRTSDISSNGGMPLGRWQSLIPGIEKIDVPG